MNLFDKGEEVEELASRYIGLEGDLSRANNNIQSQ